MLKCAVLCVSFLVTELIATSAPFITKCTAKDSDCIMKATRDTLPYLARGMPELDIAPLDPLAVPDIVADDGELKLSFRDMVVHGLSKCKMNKIERDPVKSTGFLEVLCPLTTVGNYTLGGKLSFLPVEGDGPFEIGGGNMRISVTFKLKNKMRKGKRHLKIASYEFAFEPLTKYNFKLVNLYNGDKSKAEPIQDFIDVNWKAMISGIGKPVIRGAVQAVIKIISQFFRKIPADELEIV